MQGDSGLYGHATFAGELAQKLLSGSGFREAQAQPGAPFRTLLRRSPDRVEALLIVDRDMGAESLALSQAEIVAAAEASASAELQDWPRPRLFVEVLEAGAGAGNPGATDRLGRLRETSGTPVYATLVDTASGTVWSSAPEANRMVPAATIGYVLSGDDRKPASWRILQQAQERVRSTTPVVTYALMALLVLCYAVTEIWPFERADKLYPGVSTLVAWGGNMHPYVVQGEWFRLMTASFLHAGVVHLALNLFCLLIAGKALEPLVGRLWFAGLFAGCGIAGGLGSFALNAHDLVSVGASGAIMGLFVVLLMASWRYPPGDFRTGMFRSALGVLIPSMLPWLAVGGMKVDIANHAGGAFGGCVLGCMLLLGLWPQDAIHPRLKFLPGLLCAACLGAFVWAGAVLPTKWEDLQRAGELVPPARWPSGDGDMASRLDELIGAYPKDARLYYFRAIRAIKAKNLPAAEEDMRRSMTDMEKTARIYPAPFILQARAFLALIVSDRGRQDEARAIADSACAPLGMSEMKKALIEAKLCL